MQNASQNLTASFAQVVGFANIRATRFEDVKGNIHTL
jgi:hypothetical protein